MARAIERIIAATVELIDLNGRWSTEIDPIKHGLFLERQAEDLAAYVNQLKGVKAHVLLSRVSRCSNCDLIYEVDDETGLTACCGEKPE